MKKDKEKTDVIFRIDTKGDFKGTVFALLPHNVISYFGNVQSYQHIGQHSGVDYNHCIRTSRPATKKEYKDLKKEMEGFGYNFNIVKKRNYTKYLTDLYLVRSII